MSKIFFTSDTHFGHKNIIEYCNRPWSTVEEMNEGMVERWNSKVSAEDTVYHLGDFAMGPKENLGWRQRLNGHVILIKGNHDRDKEVLKEYGFEVHKRKRLYLPEEDKIIMMTHIPIHVPDPMGRSGRTYSPNLTQKIDVDSYDYILCGHVHNQWRRRGKTINVGVDVSDFYPLTIQELLARDE